MKSKNTDNKDLSIYLQYVTNVLKFDILPYTQNINAFMQKLDPSGVNSPDSEAILDRISTTNTKSGIAVRDCLCLLMQLSDNSNLKEISINKTLDSAIKNLYFDIHPNKSIVNVTYIPPDTDIFLQGDELIVQTILYKIFDLGWDHYAEPTVYFTASHESGFTTITMKYQGLKHKMMNTESDPSKEVDMSNPLPDFNNPFSVLKLFERMGLGSLSFSCQDNYNIINFTLHLPSHKAEKASTSSFSPKEDYQWNNKTVLIVDDIEVNFIFLETILKETNVHTLYAPNGKIAVEICQKNNTIDAVLMDIKMPVMDGYKATELIKQQNPQLPVIIQTAYSFNEEYEKCRELGCNDYITKPLKSENVLSVLAKYLDN